MTHVVTESCINCRNAFCVEQCPVDCFHQGENFMVINPDGCIDCLACVAVCPENAIFSLESVPDSQKSFIKLNAELASKWEIAPKGSSRLADSGKWSGVKDKLQYLKK